MDQETTLILIIGIPLLGWCLLSVVQHGKKIEVLSKGQESMIFMIGELKEDFKLLETKINIFLKTEIDEFKNIARENTEALQQIARK